MATIVDMLITKQAQAELDKSIASLKLMHEEIIKINQQGLKFNSGASPKNPQQMNSSVKESIALNERLEATHKKMVVTSKQLEQASIRESNARNALNKQREREVQKLQASQNLYNKTQQQLNRVQNAYNNLAAKKERYNNLTAYEEARLKTLQVLTEKYNTTLKAVDATVGKHTRNVGNYASSFNPLNNSISQLGREMPAFANSVQTGFMAISNNLPIFFDAMQNVIAQNKELQAQGKPTKSALTQLAGALFSFQTLLSVGVTLLTLYGAQVYDFLSGAKKKKEAIEAEKKALEEKQKVEEQARDTTASFQSGEMARSKILFENAKNLTLTYTERKKAITELRERYPDYLKNLTDEQILAGNTADAENALNEALIKRGVALAAQEMLQKNLTDELKLRLKNAELLKQSLEDQQKIIQQGNEIVVYTDRQKAADQQKEALARKSRREQYNSYVESILALRAERQAIIATYNENAKYLGVVKENTSATKKNTKAKEDLFKAETNSRASFEKNIQALEGQLRVTSKLNPVYGALEFQLKLLKDAYEALYGEQKKQESVQDPKFGTLEYYEKLKASLEQQQKTLADTNPEWESYNRLIEAVQIDIDILTGKQKELNKTFFDSQKYFQGFVDSFANESGFSEIFNVMDLLDQDFETVEEKAKVVGLAISEAFQQAFNTISTMSDANYERMYANLERQRDVSILFAGESTTAREEIERQYEERRKRIQRQQAESQKRLAMFNIAINTAQAIMAVFAKTPPPAGIPLALLVGAIGAAQLAMTASQPIPQFYKGTQNAPEGLAWTDEKGAELHTDKNGKIKDLGSNKGARLKKLEKGDKIYTASQTKKMMDLYGFNQDFNNIMLTNGISVVPQVGQTIDFNPLKQEIRDLGSIIKNKSEVTIVNNESGTRYYERVNGQRRELVNSVLTMKSRTIR